jgi:hypothetical protein
MVMSAERGEMITAEMCFSVAGAYMPPMLIFPRKCMQQGFIYDCPLDSELNAQIEVESEGIISVLAQIVCCLLRCIGVTSTPPVLKPCDTRRTLILLILRERRQFRCISPRTALMNCRRWT